jgi:hypothetical protein
MFNIKEKLRPEVGPTKLSIMTFSLTAFSIMTLSITLSLILKCFYA